MWGVAPHKIDVCTGDGQETRRNNYNTSQPQYNPVQVNVIVIDCTNSPERSQNNQNKQNAQWHDRCSPHSVPNGPTSVSKGIVPMTWAAFLCILSVYSTSGVVGAMTLSTDFNTPSHVLQTDDIGWARLPARMSRHLVDRASLSRSTCRPHDDMYKIMISAGVASPAHTSTHWNLCMLVFCPFYLPHHSSYRWEWVSLRNTIVSLKNLQFCAISASQFTGPHKVRLNATAASFSHFSLTYEYLTRLNTTICHR